MRAFIGMTAIILAGCRGVGAPANVRPVFSGRVSGALVIAFKGTASFLRSPPELDAIRKAFDSRNFLIVGQGRESGGDRVTFTSAKGIPAPGRYHVVSPALSGGPGDSFDGLYTSEREGGGNFAADSGEITISEATTVRVVATFHFWARRYCAIVAHVLDSPCSPATIPVNAPVIEVRGSFVAVNEQRGQR